MKTRRGSILWVRAGNVRRKTGRFDRLFWDPKEIIGGRYKGPYVKIGTRRAT